MPSLADFKAGTIERPKTTGRSLADFKVGTAFHGATSNAEVAVEPEMNIPTLAEGDEWLGPQRRIAQTMADWHERLVERPADIVKSREKSGLDYGEIFSAYDAVDNDPLAVGPMRKQKLKDQIDKQRYREFFGALPGPFYNTRQAWEVGERSVELDFLWDEVRAGKVTREEAETREAEFQQLLTENPVRARNFAERLWRDTVQILPPMVAGTKKGAKAGVVAGAVVGGLGLAIPLPEEIATVPATFKAGMTAGSVYYWAKQGRGEIYREAVKSGVSHDTANLAASIGGPIYAAIEFSQIRRLAPTLNAKTITDIAMKYLKVVGENVLQEGEQKVLTEGVGTVAKAVDGIIKAQDIPAELAGDLWAGVKEIGQAVGPMSLLPLPGASMDAVATWQRQRPPATAEHAAMQQFVVQEVVGRIGAGDAETQADTIINAANKSLDTIEKIPGPITGEQVAAAIDQGVAEAQREQAVKDAEAEPEPAADLIPEATKMVEAEGKPAAGQTAEEAPAAEGKEGVQKPPGMETAGGSPTEIVKPNLYIGNVTGRMKREWAEILGVDPEEIGPYTEKGWPTKRTEIPLTRAMATDYLARAEEHLEALIGQDLIKTENDLAAANALYGDIKELRAKLGFNRAESLITRHAPKYEAVEIENVRQRIKEAIEGFSKQTLAKHEPKKLVTRGEALTGAMRKAQKESLQAWYSGRRQLRTQLREKAAIKKRKQKALQTIKREIPASVDVVYAEAIRDLKKAIDLHGRSPGVVAERRTMQRLAEKYPEQLAGMDMKRFGKLFQKPLNEFDVEELEALADEITQRIEWGKTVRATEAALYKESKRKDLETLKAGSVPITNKEIIKPKNIGEPITFSEKFTNTYHKIANWAKRKSLAITPMDVFFDMLDGTAGYGGPNYQLFKQALDTRHGKYLDRKDAIHKEIAELADQLGLEDGNFERIGVHAALQQENGRKKLNDSGYDDAMIDAVTLSPEEMQLYERMRERLDELSEPIEAVMYEVYNQPMGRVKNYFSFMTDFEAMSDFEVREFFGEKPMEYGLRKNVQRGFTITRTGGKQKIKINAMEIFLQHTDNAAYLIEMGGEIKRLAEIAASPDYAEAAGSLGRMEVLKWLDLMARKGRSQMGKVIPIVDTYRKHVGAAMLGFRLSSALVNITPLLDGTGLIGQYSFSGAVNLTDKNWRQFIVDNMPEIRDRFGGDIDLLEFGSSGIQKIERMGFWPLQKIDAIATGAVAIGAYEKNLADRGLAVDLTKPDAEALRYAQQVVRRSQSSGFYKDVPPAFTGGDLTSNRSLDRLLLQFQSFMLNRWSLIRHDMIRAGIRGNPGQAVNLFIWLSIATMAEIGLRRASKELIGLLTGADTDDWSETFNRELVVNILQNIPVVSQGVSFVAYGGVPVPSVDLAVDIGNLIQQYQRTKYPKKKAITALRTILLAGSAVSGIPGGSQAAEIVRNLGKRPPNYGKMSREELVQERKDLVYQTSGKRPDGTKYRKGETKPDKDELLKLWQEAWEKGN